MELSIMTEGVRCINSIVEKSFKGTAVGQKWLQVRGSEVQPAYDEFERCYGDGNLTYHQFVDCTMILDATLPKVVATFLEFIKKVKN